MTSVSTNKRTKICIVGLGFKCLDSFCVYWSRFKECCNIATAKFNYKILVKMVLSSFQYDVLNIKLTNRDKR